MADTVRRRAVIFTIRIEVWSCRQAAVRQVSGLAVPMHQRSIWNHNQRDVVTNWIWKPRKALASRFFNSPLTRTGPFLLLCVNVTVPVAEEEPESTATAWICNISWREIATWRPAETWYLCNHDVLRTFQEKVPEEEQGETDSQSSEN